jgi:ubiquinone/menaquinone biosynthesis C-methylase UbiE
VGPTFLTAPQKSISPACPIRRAYSNRRFLALALADCIPAFADSCSDRLPSRYDRKRKEVFMASFALSSAKPERGLGMEGFIAKWYAALTKKSLEDFRLLARQIAKQLPPDASVLEVAPGPGYFAIELAKLGNYRITGLDISTTFVEIARKNAAEAKVAIDFQRGNASLMPFKRESFDFLLCRAAFKNFAAPLGALREMHRVLKPGGRALIIDLRKDSSKESVSQAVDEMKLGAVNQVVTKLTFRYMLLKRAYTRNDFEQMIAQTGFDKFEIQESLTGLDVWLNKFPTPVLSAP